MLRLEITDAQGQTSSAEIPDGGIIGSAAACELRLQGKGVKPEHACVLRSQERWMIDALAGGVQLRGAPLPNGGSVLRAGDEVRIGEFVLRVPATAPAAAPRLVDAAPAVGAAAAPERPETAANEGLGTALGAAAGLRKTLHAHLIEELAHRRADVQSMSDAELRQHARTMLHEVLGTIAPELPAGLTPQLLCESVLDEALGLGLLEGLLADDGVSEIMVNSHDRVYIERAGKLSESKLSFTNDAAVLRIIERIVSPLGRRIDESSPMVDARLPDGSRVNAVIPPLAINGPCLTIRKFARNRLGIETLVSLGAMSSDMAKFLQACVVARKNIVVSGGTGSGKTTLLNVMSNFIPHGERIVTIEDSAELQLAHDHLVRLESRPRNIEGKGEVSIRDLLRNSLRMRPDRIVVGECRGNEALDMLQAMNTGHEGSLTTLHANTPRDALARLETMILISGVDLPLQAIREQVASGIDLVIQQTRLSSGARKVTSITEVTGMENGRIQMQELFQFVKAGYDAQVQQIDGHFRGCELMPTFFAELAAVGFDISPDLFAGGEPGPR